MTYLEAVNRLLRQALILTGDDDNLTELTSTQHQTTSNLAQLAIQSELNTHAAVLNIRTERRQGEIRVRAGQRVYDLEDDFGQFYGRQPFLYPSDNTSEHLYEYSGGLDGLRETFRQWETQQGRPRWWYIEDGEDLYAQIGLYQVPSLKEEGLTYFYEYESQKLLTHKDDCLPFKNENQNIAFIDMAVRRFKFSEGILPVTRLEDDAAYSNAYITFIALLNEKEPRRTYGRRYYSSNGYGW